LSGETIFSAEKTQRGKPIQSSAGNSAEKFCGETLQRNSAGKLCREILRGKSAEKFCGEIFLKNSAGKFCGETTKC
jgi:hypothetical protein